DAERGDRQRAAGPRRRDQQPGHNRLQQEAPAAMFDRQRDAANFRPVRLNRRLTHQPLPLAETRWPAPRDHTTIATIIATNTSTAVTFRAAPSRRRAKSPVSAAPMRTMSEPWSSA